MHIKTYRIIKHKNTQRERDESWKVKEMFSIIQLILFDPFGQLLMLSIRVLFVSRSSMSVLQHGEQIFLSDLYETNKV